MSLFKIFDWGNFKKASTVKSISVVDAHEFVLKSRITLVDVRKPEEWAETGRPRGCHGITLQDVDFLDQVRLLMKGDYTSPIAFTCRSGARSMKAAERARSAGHVDVSSVEGGFQAWSSANLPTVFKPF